MDFQCSPWAKKKFRQTTQSHWVLLTQRFPSRFVWYRVKPHYILYGTGTMHKGPCIKA